ncbi:hypothetical protein LMG31884_47130 (plasmid) [Xanthomonas hydrangeae]|uniref:N-6 DNA methylase n=1 Tax=Xanthomonas hydrangeae TaxID=2775159 RepID=UPI0019659745|nr:hypothetical protein LMG31884_47130 [Xanthomonas hydrangeae]CAD7740983.1 hypothetical protein LMG31884_47130 [Xanthomonas hydrangeae]CAD7747994.1 hypothetical protein LMG31887_46680 [Xanthomonas hydrangeae]CAD7747995.1 hypothetical protein LMG31887_46680 [Xanthomonas hydrangeae]CAD7748128.1 hypothetical protein LMG31885_44810 [Xanthomonas hydrangeae]
MSRKSPVGLTTHQKEFVKLIRANTAGRYRLHDVFRDFCEMAALSISNAVDRSQYAGREARFLEIEKRYTPEERERFQRMLAELVMCLEEGFSDCLGALFMALELGDDWKGQYFTPYEVSRLMAGISAGDLKEKISGHGFVTVNEPACGAGGMVIAFADELRSQGLNHSEAMHAVSIDIDPTAVHMAYVQLSLLGIPAIVVHGDALWPAEKTWAHWVTPIHVLGRWDERLAMRERFEAMRALLAGGYTPAQDGETSAPPAVPSRSELVVQRLTADQQMALF